MREAEDCPDVDAWWAEKRRLEEAYCENDHKCRFLSNMNAMCDVCQLLQMGYLASLALCRIHTDLKKLPEYVPSGGAVEDFRQTLENIRKPND